MRLAKIDELAASFAEIEGSGAATSVFQEMTRILTSQGVDEAIAYVASQRVAILQTVRARVAPPQGNATAPTCNRCYGQLPCTKTKARRPRHARFTPTC